MKDFRFLAEYVKYSTEIADKMNEMMLPFEGKVQAWHHDILMETPQRFLITISIQLKKQVK